MLKKNIRVIPRIDIKGDNLVKGVNLEGFRALGNANLFIEEYYKQQADEILLNDVVASLYDQNSLNNFIKRLTKKIFVPLIVGGGIKSLNDIEHLLKSGADRVFINSAMLKKPKFLDESIKYFGSSTIIASIEANKISNKYMCLTNSGRDETKRDVLSWAKEVESRGASEILLTSIKNEGLGNGFDIELMNLLNKSISIPFIVSGGYGKITHLKEILKFQNLSAVSVASAIHYSTKDKIKINNEKFNEGNYEFLSKNINYKSFEKTSIKKIKKYLND